MKYFKIVIKGNKRLWFKECVELCVGPDGPASEVVPPEHADHDRRG